ncbi:DUF6233 domain-containing protein [Streptomyces globisporus]|uniref:DUF6233 domain-containing protein n=1 Tax=Streptomyces globisporus TaxID=1908 RepID=UPI003CC7CB0B
MNPKRSAAARSPGPVRPGGTTGQSLPPSASAAVRRWAAKGADACLGPRGGRYRVPVPQVHRSGCWAGGRGRSLVPVSAERARAELVGGAQPCAVCRPDRVLTRP